MKIIKRAFSLAALCLLSALTPLPAGAYEAVNVKIPVNCVDVTDRESQTYTIRIKPETPYAPEPLSDTLVIKEDETGFFDLSVTEPGTFDYKIYETAGDNDGIKYDEHVYTVSLFAENDDSNGLRCAIVANTGENESKSVEIVFSNTVINSGRDDKAEATDTTENATAPTAETNTQTTAESSSAASLPTDAADNKRNSDDDKSSIGGFITDVLTGDNFPAHALRTALFAALITAIAAFLLKRRNSGEEDECNE